MRGVHAPQRSSLIDLAGPPPGGSSVSLAWLTSVSLHGLVRCSQALCVAHERFLCKTPCAWTVHTEIVDNSTVDATARGNATLALRMSQQLAGNVVYYASPELEPGYLRLAALWPTLQPADCASTLHALQRPAGMPTDELSGMRHLEAPRSFAPDASVFTQPPPTVAAYAYDCVAALALALEAVDAPPIHGNRTSTLAFLAHLANVSFSGASGDVGFERDTLDRLQESASFAVSNLARDGAGVKLVQSHKLTDAGMLSIADASVLTWKGGARGPPDDPMVKGCPPVRNHGPNSGPREPPTQPRIEPRTPPARQRHRLMWAWQRHALTWYGVRSHAVQGTELIRGIRCLPCEVNFYKPDWGMGTCRHCPLTTSQRMAGSASCECAVGYVSNTTTGSPTAAQSATPSEPNNNCIVCPVGAWCPLHGTVPPTMLVERGYWRSSTNSTDVWRCPDATVGCSAFSTSVCAESQSACAGNTSPSRDGAVAANLTSYASGVQVGNLCRAGLEGPFCLLCSQPSAANGSSPIRRRFVKATHKEGGHCEFCDADAGRTAWRAIGYGLLAVVVICLLARAWIAYMPGRVKARLLAHHKHIRNNFTPQVKMKIIFSFYVVITSATSVCELTIPNRMRDVLTNFGIVATLGASSAGPFEGVLDCSGASGYRGSLRVYIVLPVVLSAICVLVSAILQFKSFRMGRSLPPSRDQPSKKPAPRSILASQAFWRAVIEWALYPVMLLLFVAYPLLTTKAFQAFHEYDFGVDGRVLKVDVSIRVPSAEHDLVRRDAIVAILIYPFGLTVGTALLVFKLRRSIGCDPRQPSSMGRALQFLCECPGHPLAYHLPSHPEASSR